MAPTPPCPRRSAISSEEELRARVACPADFQLAGVDFSREQLIVVHVDTDDGYLQASFVEQGATMSTVYVQSNDCPGGMARQRRDVLRAVVAPRAAERRAAP